MNKENLQLRRLGENDKVVAFDCGDEDLNDFILTDAPLYYRVRLATSKVSCRSPRPMKVPTPVCYISIWKA